MGGLTFEKILVIGIIAVFIFGPDRLPTLAAQLAQLIKRVRGWTEDAKSRVSEELGDDFSEEDWRKLDPRQYDPRRIIRDAWNEADPNATSAANTSAKSIAGVGAGAVAGGTALSATSGSTVSGSSAPAWATKQVDTSAFTPGHAPFDAEAT
ncbi:twin-arginine translocase TatA/TatE family subunit [Gulosibacter chungangensis]|nr:twin-arginine translocase TatA/TatE family subunit [Gulosibacter chungangensis]